MGVKVAYPEPVRKSCQRGKANTLGNVPFALKYLSPYLHKRSRFDARRCYVAAHYPTGGVPIPMKSLFTILTLALCAGVPLVAKAQTARPVQMQEASQAGPDGLIKLHITDEINSTPEAKAALADFHRRKAAGLLPNPRKTTDVVGDTVTFRVFNSVTRDLDNIDFELVAVDPAEPSRFQIWVELAELDDGTVDQAVIDSIMVALGERTPAGSFNPNAGIIENEEIIYGDPPDVDGDGITDVLLVDLRDDFDPETNPAFLAGFVVGGDLRQNGGTGNFRDILYLDTDPTLVRRGIGEVAQTAAHEYQHLIHFNWDTNEDSFINEGLSEHAEVVMGYQARPVNYLAEAERVNVPLLRWLGNDQFDDRQRGAMFINYIADQFGIVPDNDGRGGIGKITRNDASGSAGLRGALINMQITQSLEEVIFDFHTANYFNDTSLDLRYGYTTEQRLGLRAVPLARFDGRVDTETGTARVGVAQGGAVYLVWEQVKDLTVTLSAVGSDTDLRADAFVFGTDGSFQGTRSLSLSGDETFDGETGRLVVVLANVNPDGPLKNVDYSAQWSEPEALVSLLTTQYDNGRPTPPFFRLGSGEDGVLATRFINPFPDRSTLLDRVWIHPFFINQFADSEGPIGTPNDPRDVTFYVWGPGGDGFPGDSLFSMVMTDPRAFGPVTNPPGPLNFIEIDMVPFASELGQLPDTLYIGFGEAGQDDNELVVGVSPYAVENVSFIGRLSDGAWGTLWDVRFVGGDPEARPVAQTVIPMRARFAIPTATAVADEAEVPEEIVLYQNFPNPFNPITSVRYSLPRATEVRLAVYDLLGREVAVLVDGMGAPGLYEVQVDAGHWASGVYFYTLQTATQKVTQRMVLVK